MSFIQQFEEALIHLPGYQRRDGQETFAAAIHNTIVNHRVIAGEAETGTGKTLAYLLASMFANQAITVSTATKSLQSQIIEKDVPFLRNFARKGLVGVVLKGRSNYVCLRRWHLLTDDALFLAFDPRFVDWIKAEADGGDLDRFPDGRPDDVDEINSTSDTCWKRKCPFYAKCHVYNAKRKAEEADIVVVNHALVCADIAVQRETGTSILPWTPVFCADEAHELESVATNFFEDSVSVRGVMQLLTKFEGCIDSRQHPMVPLINTARDTAQKMFRSFEHKEKYVITGKMVAKGTPRKFALDAFYEAFCLVVDKAIMYDEFKELQNRMDSTQQTIYDLFSSGDESFVYWVDTQYRAKNTRICRTPLDVGPILREHIWESYQSSIAVSATITTGGTFDFFKNQVGLPEERLDTIVVKSPFDFRQQCQIYVPRDAPDPASGKLPGYTATTAQQLEPLIDGGMFVLFTSRKNMEEAHHLLSGKLTRPLLTQGPMGMKILDVFKQQPSVLLALKTFWQGVDVQGEALQAVVIDKLPFPSYRDPVPAARRARLGRSAFMKWDLPTMIIMLKQGIGRAIRTVDDQAIVAILDSRLWRKGYGQMVFNSLPDCRIVSSFEELVHVGQYADTLQEQTVIQASTVTRLDEYLPSASEEQSPMPTYEESIDSLVYGGDFY